MHYEGNIIRPPSEAGSILLQATVGCSHNRCGFCGSYRGERFKIKPDSVIDADIAFAATHCRRQRRVFICDGDALIIPQKRLLRILKAIRSQLPWVTRVGLYGNTKSIDLKSSEELSELASWGLGIVYMGLESGDDVTLHAICKGANSGKMIAMGRKVRSAGIRLSVTVLLGVAGIERSDIHARETGRVLTEIDPEFVGALSLMLIPGTPMFEAQRSGRFTLPGPEVMLKELRSLIEATHMTRGLFHANHASNYLPIRARMPKDKDRTLALLDQALTGAIALKPEYLRAL